MNLLLIDELYLCSLNKKGKISGSSNKLNLFLAGLMTLKLEEIIGIENQRIEVITDLPADLERLQVLYNLLKTTKSNKVVDIYSKFESSMDGKMIQFFEDVGDYLNEKRIVELQRGRKGKIIQQTNKYIPNQAKVDGIVQRIRAEVLEDDIMTEDTLLLVYFLDKSEKLDIYFSKYEQSQLENKINQIKNNSESLELTKIVKAINDLESMIAVFTVLLMSHGS
ncbi:GPP34 family phosphoprotein [Erysipelothrix urinaevulpis]|uniref:GPP34 family phosphoprotein n=1 Tax=Erysipelothrix urinaevulpis TaxID=2683717 RepID=UPI001356CAFA|nr:GPP34 family phosphoprotein [Erysipelothrix urinaevulpis]